MSSAIEILGEMIAQSTREVFGSAGAELTDPMRGEPVAAWLDPIAVIGFGGDEVRGSVTLEVPWRVLQATHPSRSAVPEDLTDWVGELANVVIGSVKRRLRARNVKIQPGLPMSFTPRPTESAVMSSCNLQYRLASAEGAVLVRICAELAEGLELSDPQSAEVPGNIQLF